MHLLDTHDAPLKRTTTAPSNRICQNERAKFEWLLVHRTKDYSSNETLLAETNEIRTQRHARHESEAVSVDDVSCVCADAALRFIRQRVLFS